MKARIYNYSYWVTETDPKTLFAMYNEILLQSGFTILGKIDYFFEPYGYTCLWLLGESHLAIHTFPEDGKSYIELSSCILSKYNEFVQRI